MKTLLKKISVIAFAILICSTANAQDKKAERQEKRKLQEIERLEGFSQMFQNKKFKFSVRSVDLDLFPQYSNVQLRGAYFVRVNENELTVELPLLGGAVRAGGMASALKEARFTTNKFVMTYGNFGDIPNVITIKTEDPHLQTGYTMFIYTNGTSYRLTVIATGADKVTYKGAMAALK